MKRVTIIVLILMLLTACASKDDSLNIKEKSVKTLMLQEEVYPELLQYLGVVRSEEIKKYAFLSGGVVEQVAVAVGDVVAEKQLLATLQSDKLDISVDSAAEQQRTAQLDYSKAQQSFQFYEDLLQDSAALLAAGALSQQQYDEVELKRNIAQKELSQAAARSEQARLQAEYSADNVDDASLLSDIAGTVLEVNYKAGEIVAPGYPVVLLRSNRNAIQVGVSADDIKKLAVGDLAEITLPDGQIKTAPISKIHLIPDSGSRTYTVEIAFDDDGSLLLGETVDVSFAISKQRGIWLPIATILNDGLDYVYIVEDGRAKRVDISLQMIYQDKVMVSGLQPGDQLVVSGVQSLSPGYKVKVVEQVEQAPSQTTTTGADDE